MQEAGIFEMQVLRHAEAEAVRNVKVRRALLRMRVVGILGVARGGGAGGSGAADHHACVVNCFAPGVAGLESWAAVGHGAGERRLQRVVGGVRIGDDDVHDTDAADDIAGLVEARVGRELLCGSRIGVGVGVARQLFRGSAHIGRVGSQVAEFTLHAQRPGVKLGVAKGEVDTAEVERADHAALRGGQVLLVAVNVHDGVGGNIFWAAAGKDVCAIGRVGVRQLRRADGETVGQRRGRRGETARVNSEGCGAGEEVVLPDVGWNGGDGSAQVRGEVAGRRPRKLHARRECLPVGLIAGLRVDDVLHDAIDDAEGAGAMRALGDRCVELPAHAVIQRKVGSHLPGVLHVDCVVFTVDSGRADVLTAGEERRRDGHGVAEGRAGEQPGERVGQGVADGNIVHAAGRRNCLGGIGGAGAKSILAVGADAEVCGVAVDARLETGLDGVARSGEGEVLTALEEVAVGLHHRAGRAVKRLEETIAEDERGIYVVVRGEARRGARDADGGLEHHAWRKVPCPGTDYVALAVNVLDGEGRVDGGLAGIGGGAGEIVQVEAREELIFRGEPVIKTDRELIGVGDHFGCGGVGVLAVGAGGVIGQRIAGQNGSDG